MNTHGTSRNRQARLESAVTVHVDIAFSRGGARRRITLPDGSAATRPAPRTASDIALLNALALAFRWRKLTEKGTHATVADLAEAEKINPSHASRVLRLTLLAPEIVQAILDRRTAPEMTLARLLKPFPIEWAAQAREFSAS